MHACAPGAEPSPEDRAAGAAPGGEGGGAGLAAGEQHGAGRPGRDAGPDRGSRAASGSGGRGGSGGGGGTIRGNDASSASSPAARRRAGCAGKNSSIMTCVQQHTHLMRITPIACVFARVPRHATLARRAALTPERFGSRITRTMSAIAPSVALLARPASVRRSSSRRSVGVRASADKKSYLDLKGEFKAHALLSRSCRMQGRATVAGRSLAAVGDRYTSHE